VTESSPSLTAPASAAAAPTTAAVAAARAGGGGGAKARAAWEELYREFAPMVHGVLLARGVRPATEADDLTHEVFMSAMRHARGLREDQAIGAWLAALARNAAVDHARAAKRAGGLLKLIGRERNFASAAEKGSGPDRERVREAERVLGVILSLPEAYHETLVLRLLEGLTGPQIAASLGMTHGSVRVNLVRGMAMLKERLNAPP
jgi:RNA polymerase sigma-70 factor (ECF subfamily)